MTAWELLYHWAERDEWKVFTRGSLEDVLSDALDSWPYGVDAIRIERHRND